LAKDIKVCQDRQASSKVKQEGDWEFYKERLDEAMVKYEEALVEDKENEYAISNIGLIHLKKREYEQCIDMSTKALTIIENFQSETKSFQTNNALEVKILLRRAKCFESLNEMEKAKFDLDKLLLLEP
jgi:tetratricopeptide (TPR) repeat protein